MLNNPLIFTDPSGYFSEATKDFIDRIASALWGLPDGSSWSASGGFSIGHPDLSSGSKVSQYLEHSMSGGGGGTFRIRQLNVSQRNGSPLFPWVTGDGKLHKDPVIQLILEPILEPFLPELSYQANDNISFITRQSGDEPGGRVNDPKKIHLKEKTVTSIMKWFIHLEEQNFYNPRNEKYHKYQLQDMVDFSSTNKLPRSAFNSGGDYVGESIITVNDDLIGKVKWMILAPNTLNRNTNLYADDWKFIEDKNNFSIILLNFNGYPIMSINMGNEELYNYYYNLIF